MCGNRSRVDMVAFLLGFPLTKMKRIRGKASSDRKKMLILTLGSSKSFHLLGHWVAFSPLINISYLSLFRVWDKNLHCCFFSSFWSFAPFVCLLSDRVSERSMPTGQGNPAFLFQDRPGVLGLNPHFVFLTAVFCG